MKVDARDRQDGMRKVRQTGLAWWWVGVCVGLWAGGHSLVVASSEGESVVVVFNRRQPGSQDLAYYYAQRRQVPTNQIFGLELPTTETMSRDEFRRDLQRPLLRILDRQGLMVLRSEVRRTPGRDKIGEASMQVKSARIRYLVLCYGVPVKIAADPGLSEGGVEELDPALRRNEASVDTELAWLPKYYDEPRLAGPSANPVYGQSKAETIGPKSGVLMVARLDAPSEAVARRLVESAMQAEREGLWGRAYIDLRGVTGTNYVLGDQWLAQASDWLRRAGFETVTDTNAATYARGFPMSQIAFYAGWYEEKVSGPLDELPVEFMPGAFAYHLHSFSAQTLRTTTERWVGPLLDRGATASVGFTEEPYLHGTLDVGTFVSRWIQGGFSLGEAVYAAMPVLSWQATVVGDPLYRPFGRVPRSDPLGHRLRELHALLTTTTNRWVEWSHLQVVNLGLMQEAGVESAEVISYLKQAAEVLRSPVLAEKLGDVQYQKGRIEPAIRSYRESLEYGGSPQQRLRVMLALARLQAAFKQEAEALGTYGQLLASYPDYADRDALLRAALALARDLGREAAATEFAEELGL